MNKRSREEWQVFHPRAAVMTGLDFKLKSSPSFGMHYKTLEHPLRSDSKTGREGDLCAMQHEGGHSVPWPDKEATATPSL